MKKGILALGTFAAGLVVGVVTGLVISCKDDDDYDIDYDDDDMDCGCNDEYYTMHSPEDEGTEEVDVKIEITDTPEK